MAFHLHDPEDPARKFLLFAEAGEGEGEGGGSGNAEGAGDAGGEGQGKGAAEGGEGEGRAAAGKGAGNGAADPADWRASIEDADLRTVAERFDSPTSMTKAVADLRKRESNSIRIPGKDASDEDTAAYRKALGVPEAVEGYEFTAPEGKDFSDADKAFQAAAAQAFLDNDIPAEKAKGLIDWWNASVEQAQQDTLDADKAHAAETDAALKRKWPGEEFARNKAHADEAFRFMFGEDADKAREIETKDGRFLMDQTILVEAFAKLGREMPGKGGIDRVMTDGDRDGVQQQIDDLQVKIDKATASMDRETAQKAYLEQQALYAKLYGNAPVVGAEGRTV